jgi:hypothetical protein
MLWGNRWWRWPSGRAWRIISGAREESTIPGWIVEGYATLLHKTDTQFAGRGLAQPSMIVVPADVGSPAA